MSGGYWVSFRGVYPDMTPVPKEDGRAWFYHWFGDDEAGARAAYDAFDGDAVFYRIDSLSGPLGHRVIASKSS